MRGFPSDLEKRKEYLLVSSLPRSIITNPDSWFADYGASKHMTGYKSIFPDFRKKNFLEKVELGDNKIYVIKGFHATYLHLEFGYFIHIDEILYVP